MGGAPEFTSEALEARTGYLGGMPLDVGRVGRLLRVLGGVLTAPGIAARYLTLSVSVGGFNGRCYHFCFLRIRLGHLV